MTTPNPDLACQHENAQFQVDVILLEDSGKRQADIRGWCSDCEEPFLWAEQIPIGVDLSGVARSVDGQELRVAMTSAADFPPGSHRDQRLPRHHRPGFARLVRQR